jgi:hypothetical protein
MQLSSLKKYILGRLLLRYKKKEPPQRTEAAHVLLQGNIYCFTETFTALIPFRPC